MKTTVIPTLILSLLIFISCSRAPISSQKNDLVNEELKGPVKTMVSKYYAAQKMNDHPDFSKEIKHFNRAGFLKMSYKLNKSGEKEDWAQYFYNDQNQLMQVQFLPKKADSDSKNLFTYDSRGNLISTQNSYNGKIDFWDECTYDDRNRYVLGKRTNHELQLFTSEKIIYSGNKTVSYNYDESGKIVSKITQVKNSNDQVVSYTAFNQQGKKVLQVNSEYNPKGFVSTSVSRGEKGNVTKTRNEYRYDSHGNWIEMKTITNDTLRGFEKRKITYY